MSLTHYAMKTYREWMCTSTFPFLSWHLLDVSGQLHARLFYFRGRSLGPAF
jgi:hypothetical protein